MIVALRMSAASRRRFPAGRVMNHFGTSQWLVIVSTRFESLQRRPLKFTAARKYVMVPGMSVMAVSTRFVSLQRHPLKIHSGGELCDGSRFLRDGSVWL